MHAAVALCTGLVVLALADPSSHAPSCRQNQGRACTRAESLTRHFDVLNGTMIELDQREIHAHNKFIFDAQWGHYFNPGVVVYNNTLYVVARKDFHDNRPNPWVICPDDSVYRSKPCPVGNKPPGEINLNAFFSISPLGRVTSEVVALDFHFPTSSVTHITDWHGPQDPRVFTWGSDIYIIYNAHPIRLRQYRDMWVQRLFPKLSEPVELVGEIFLGGSVLEKNWSPIDKHHETDDYLFSRFVNPHEVWRCSRTGACGVISTTDRTPFFDQLKAEYKLKSIHLGTNAVRVSDQYYGAIFHGLVAGHSPTAYLNFPYFISTNPPYEIVCVSAKPLHLPMREYAPYLSAFSSGLAFVDGRLVIAYGIIDISSNLYVDTVDSVVKDMVRIETGSEGRICG